MLKRIIKYTDFNGTVREEEYRFNLTKSELVMLQAEEDLQKTVELAQDKKDVKTVMRIFRKIILFAYGEVTPDGKSFIKSEQMREEFEQTAAYDALFMELLADEQAASAFMDGVLPKK